MATFLTLCQRVAAKSGTISGTLPTSVSGQTGRLAKIVDWVAEAWTEIQNRRSAWKWMRAEFSAVTIANTARYTPAALNITNLARWHVDNLATGEQALSLYLQSTGASDEGPLTYITWALWKARYGRGSQTARRPTEYAISPAGELCLGPVPDDVYVVNGEYWKTPQTLAANGDIPEMPERFHDTITHRALMFLAQYDEATTAYATAFGEYTTRVTNLDADQSEDVIIGADPIA